MFQRARSKEQVDERRKEIVEAMESLYMKEELSHISIKEVAEKTHISRTAIYSYYQSKEEILLDCLRLHFAYLDSDLEKLLSKKDFSNQSLSKGLTSIFVKNPFILKVMSTDLEEIERHTSLESLIELKKEMGNFQQLFKDLLRKSYPNAKEESLQMVLYTFIALLYGYYPLTNPIAIQKQAMKETNTEINITLEELIGKSIQILVSSLEK